MRIRATRKT